MFAISINLAKNCYYMQNFVVIARISDYSLPLFLYELSTMNEQQANIWLGTSSWLFDGWRGVFYPEKWPKDQYLAYYVRQFNTVEVNTSFYAIPQPTTLVKWVEVAPPGFTFTLKFPQAISHQKRLVNCQAETLVFLDVLRSLGQAAGPGFLQLPPDFTRQREGRALADYLDWLAGQIEGLRIAVEVRAKDLMTDAFIRFLTERHLALVLVDRVHQPDLYEIWWELMQTEKQLPFCMVRWIGDDKQGPQGDAELVAPRDGQLDLWAQRLAQVAQAGIDVYGYMHNPYEGHSPASIRRLQARLATHIPLPNWQPIDDSPDEPGQLSLF